MNSIEDLLSFNRWVSYEFFNWVSSPWCQTFLETPAWSDFRVGALKIKFNSFSFLITARRVLFFSIKLFKIQSITSEMIQDTKRYINQVFASYWSDHQYRLSYHIAQFEANHSAFSFIHIKRIKVIPSMKILCEFSSLISIVISVVFNESWKMSFVLNDRSLNKFLEQIWILFGARLDG